MNANKIRKSSLMVFPCIILLSKQFVLNNNFHSFTPGKLLPIYIKSEACDDSGIKGCGHAVISVAGKDYSKQGRGYNVVVVDAKTGIDLVSLILWL